MNRFAQLFRLGNCLMGIVGLLLGAWIATGEGIVDSYVQLAVAAGVVFAFIAGGNALNDYKDREVDKQAHPERPIPSGRMNARTALNISIIMFAISFGLSLLLDIISIAVVISAIAIMLAYEVWLKAAGLVGNLSIAWLTAALFLLGGAVVGAADRTVVVGAMAFLATLGREIVKDVQDMESDFDRTTLPKTIGRRRAGYVASIAFLGAVLLSFQPVAGGFSYDLRELGYLITVLFADGIFIYCSIVHFQNPKRGQVWAKGGMLVALVAFLLGGGHIG